MRLTLKRYGDGRLRPRWYGDFERDGERRVVTLCRWHGQPPASGSVSDLGDYTFEASRAAALAELRQALEGERTEADQAALAERIHRARYGSEVPRYPLKDLPDLWLAAPRKHPPSPLHVANRLPLLRGFVEYMSRTAPDVTEIGGVTGKHLAGYMDAERRKELSGRSLNVRLSLLRGMFKRLDPNAPAVREYFAKQPAAEESPAHREPFTGDQLRAVFDAAKGDPLLRPLVVCAACTAMRRGDVCRLRWRDVDLAGGFVTVKTAKTGGTVEIPILPPLRTELNAARRGRGKPDGFVWPDAAAMYRNAPDALDRRLRAILARAGFVRPDNSQPEAPEGDAAQADAPRPEVPTLATLPPHQTERRGLDAIAVAPGWTDKRRNRTREIFKRYMAGESVKHIAAAMKQSTGIVSLRLHDVQRMIGTAVIRRPDPASAPALEPVGMTLAPVDDRAPRQRRGSLKGWHSFRTTWITLALSAGVPMPLVQRVTGHRTVDVVLKHYFKPGRDQLREALQAAMPAALLAGPAAEPAKDWRTEVRRIAATLPAIAAKERAELLALAHREDDPAGR